MNSALQWPDVAAALSASITDHNPLAVAAAKLQTNIQTVDAECRINRHMPAAVWIQQLRCERAFECIYAATQRPQQVSEELGFAASATLNQALLARYGLDAQAIARLRGAKEFQVRLPAAFSITETLQYLGRDPASLAQRRTSATSVAAGIWVCGRPATLRLHFDGPQRVNCELVLRGRHPQHAARAAHAIAARFLGFSSATDLLQQRADADPLISRLVGLREGLRLPLTATPFDALTWSILGQQISLSFAYTLLRTCCELAGARCPGGLTTMPVAQRLAELSAEQLTQRQLSRAKVQYLQTLAADVASGAVQLEALADGSAMTAYQTLIRARGIGPWTANYVMMRGFGFADCAPIGDAGLRRALTRFFALPAAPTDREMVPLMAQFSPHQSLATYHLWRGSDNALD